MLTPGRTLVAMSAGIGLFGSLAGVVLMHPMGLFAQASGRQSTLSTVTQPDFAPMDDRTAEPRPTKVSPEVNVY